MFPDTPQNGFRGARKGLAAALKNSRSVRALDEFTKILESRNTL